MIVPMSLHRLIESRIQDAINEGAFENLAGRGRPLRPDEGLNPLAGDNALGYKVLQNAGMLPTWLSLAREIEADEQRLVEFDQRHAEWVQLAESSGSWERLGPAVRRLRERYAVAARELRRKQDQFNHDAPSIRLERPGIWVEHALERLDERVRAAGAPEWVLAPYVAP